MQKLRTGNHNLQIETGRHCRPKKQVCDRICLKCDSGEVEDEVHFLIHCDLYSELRSQYLTIDDSLDDNLNFTNILSTFDKVQLTNLASYIQKAFDLRNTITTINTTSTE